MRTRHLGALAAVALLSVLAPRAAYAYLDPATGSAVLQVLVGGVMGGLYLVKRYWRQLKARVTGAPPDDAGAPPEPPAGDGDPD